MTEGTAASRLPTSHFIPPGFTSITPYILVRGAPQFIEFLKSAFAAEERLRVPTAEGAILHAEIAIGNGMIEVGDASAEHAATPVTIHLYVDDADATFVRALQAGATGISAPTDEHPSGDHWGTAKDPFGNYWHIATVRDWTPGPEGVRSVQPYLHLREAHKMIPFLESAFGAETLGLHKSPDGIVRHATIRIGNATLEIDEAHGEYAPTTGYLHVYVPDPDALYAQALHAGATSVDPPADKPYGERSAGVRDPFGNTWYLARFLGRRSA